MLCVGYTDAQHLETITTKDVCCSLVDHEVVCPTSKGFAPGGDALWCATGANGNGPPFSTDPNGDIHNGTKVVSDSGGNLWCFKWYVGETCEGFTDLNHLETIATTQVCCKVPVSNGLVCHPPNASNGPVFWCAKGADTTGLGLKVDVEEHGFGGLWCL